MSIMKRHVNTATDDDGKVTAVTASHEESDGTPEVMAASSGPFAVGDVVRPKAGGPDGTVESVEETQAVVVWFHTRPGGGWDGPSRSTFPIAGLERVK